MCDNDKCHQKMSLTGWGHDWVSRLHLYDDATQNKTGETILQPSHNWATLPPGHRAISSPQHPAPSLLSSYPVIQPSNRRTIRYAATQPPYHLIAPAISSFDHPAPWLTMSIVSGLSGQLAISEQSGLSSFPLVLNFFLRIISAWSIMKAFVQACDLHNKNGNYLPAESPRDWSAWHYSLNDGNSRGWPPLA